MTQAEQTLDAFFADDGLPARDQAFTLAVMRRAAKKRLRAELLSLAGICLLAALVLWGLAPGLQPLLGWSARLIEAAGPALGIISLLVSMVSLTSTSNRPEASLS